MRIGPRTRVASILDTHPELETVLEWYRVRLDDVDYTLRLTDFCDRNDIDLDDLLVEFDAALDDDEDDEDDEDDDYEDDDLDDEDEDLDDLDGLDDEDDDLDDDVLASEDYDDDL